MRHLDLFSGIGGNSLATDWVWPGMEHVFCEINPFCRQVLRKHWPHSLIYEDIKKLQPADVGPVFLLTAGVPCQPASTAGKRRGTQDDRWLWPRTLEIALAIQPEYAVFENPPGILSLSGGDPLRDILSALGNGGYETRLCNLPAGGVEAPHERQRIFIVAHDTRQRAQRKHVAEQRQQDGENAHASGKSRGTPDLVGSPVRTAKEPEPACRGATVSGSNHWAADPLEDIYRLCAPLHGLPRRLVRLPDGSSISEAKWRREAIQAAGNAVVPAQVYPIFEAIKACDESL